MPKSKIILSLGFLIALLPVLGFPQSWESFLEVASGLIIVLLSVLMSVDRRLTLKAKAEKRASRKRALVNASLAEVDPEMFGRRETDHIPPVIAETQPIVTGRRASDRRVRVRDADKEESQLSQTDF